MRRRSQIGFRLGLIAGVACFCLCGFAAAGAIELNLGKAEVGRVRKDTVVVENTTDAEWVLDRFSSSCSCLTIVSFPKQIAPRQTGSVEVLYKPEKAGVARIDLIGSSASAAVVAKLQIRYMVVEPMEDILAEAKELVGKTKLTLVDVRAPSEFQQAHIPGAINLSWQDLRIRKELAGAEIAVVNYGIPDAESISRVRSLRSGGFRSIHLVRGGIEGWRQAGGRLEGPGVRSWRVASLPLVAIAGLLHSPDYRLIEITDAVETKAGAAWSAWHVQEPLRLAELIRQENAAGKTVLLAGTPQLYDELYKIAGLQVYYLNEGAAGLQAHGSVLFSENRSQVMHFRQGISNADGPHGKRIQPSGCSSCPQ